MRKSKLGLFKSTSMLISVIGIIMIAVTIIAAAYVGYSMVSSSIIDDISSGTQLDQLADLKSDYNNLSAQFDSVKASYYAGSTDDVQRYNDARLELSRAETAINNVESGINGEGISSDEVDSRIQHAREKLKIAHQAYDNL